MTATAAFDPLKPEPDATPQEFGAFCDAVMTHKEAVHNPWGVVTHICHFLSQAQRSMVLDNLDRTAQQAQYEALQQSKLDKGLIAYAKVGTLGGPDVYRYRRSVMNEIHDNDVKRAMTESADYLSLMATAEQEDRWDEALGLLHDYAQQHPGDIKMIRYISGREYAEAGQQTAFRTLKSFFEPAALRAA